ncbi:V-type ATPase 116kDa subunit family protein [uncultured Bacteroides sp.]|uniref:V-type ATP synthase subunit I n=1 Tax=uncultured Bacteroides sp. TaxID=162156 RepID=UPI00262CFA55|nr:V-type ATPase 116kDa subunit family protein [uncultured Bacteroides sp.]
MIAKMKKLTFLVYYKEYEQFLERLRELGVVHIFTKSQGVAENQELQNRIRLAGRYAAAIKFLQGLNVVADKHEGEAKSGEKALELLTELQNKQQQLAHKRQALEKEIASLEPWGDFEAENIERLRKAGYVVNFYICSEKQFNDEWISDYNATVINKIGSKVYFVTITSDKETPELEVEYAKLPEKSLSGLKAAVESLFSDINNIESNINELAKKSISDLEVAQKKIYSEIEFSKVVLTGDSLADNKLVLLEGWVPEVKSEDVKSFMDNQGAYYEISAPTPEDNVPILFKNDKFSRLFEPIIRLYMLPKYNELDLTPFFAPFFMLFFGLCLGDTGYGAFMVLAVTVYRLMAKNISSGMKPILTLVQILGASTMVCGLLTGTCFGFNLYDIQLPFLQKMKETIALDNQQMFNLSLILGGIQIIFGMMLKAVNQTIQLGFKYAVGTIGWIFVILSSAIAFAGAMEMGGTVHMVFVVAGLLMAYLYNSPGKNVFVNIGLGLWDSYNMATGLLGDILSYVRLFALGLSGGILASVFNSLASGMSPDNVIAGSIVMVLIFVIGHSINIFMNVLGAMVHPMRLTFVEFFKNSGYEGGGKEYSPFKK